MQNNGRESSTFAPTKKADNSTKEIISLSLVKGDVTELPLTPPPHKEKRKCIMETLFRFSSHSKCQCTPLWDHLVAICTCNGIQHIAPTLWFLTKTLSLHLLWFSLDSHSQRNPRCFFLKSKSQSEFKLHENMEQHIMDPKDLPIVLEVEKGITGIWYSR